jgi:hypothetical protein
MQLAALARYVALPASAALLVLTECASSGSGGAPAASSPPGAGSPMKLIRAAYQTTTSAKTARMTLATDVSFPGGSENLNPFTIDIVEDFQHNILEETMDVPNQGNLEARLLGNDVYIRMPAYATSDPDFKGPTPAKPWMYFRVPSGDEGASSELFSVLDGSVANPKEFVLLLTGASSSVTRLGTDVVRGQQSTHYRLSIDAAEIMKMAGSDLNCDSAADTTTPVDVWLDGQGRLTRMKVSEKFPSDFSPDPSPVDIPTEPSVGPGSAWPTNAPTSLPSPARPSGSPALSMTIEVYDYGADLHVSPPPRDQVQDVTKYYEQYAKQRKLKPSPSRCPTH